MDKKSSFIFDFDSTFIRVEAMDLLAEIILEANPKKDTILAQIGKITHLGMEGRIPFRESLIQRLALINPSREHIKKLIPQIREKISESFKRNKTFFTENAERIYILSNGFHAFIDPVVIPFGIKKESIFANNFRFNKAGYVIGFDEKNPLSANNGKVEQLKKLDLQGDIYMIGDGYTDYETKQAGLVNKFFAFTENIAREDIVKKADHITPSLDEFLYLNKFHSSVSYPKNRIKILVLENISQVAIEKLEKEGFQVTIHPAGMNEEDLCKVIKNYSILCIRSKTQVTKQVLDHGQRLMAIGAFCIGTNQIDLQAASLQGVAVFNAPFSNTRSVVELTLAEIILLMRNLPDKMMGMHQGKWNKSAAGSVEIRNKTLGIIGYGNIGSQLSVLAENIGMRVCYYDLDEKLALGNATPSNSLKELLEQADAVSIHVDGRKSNHHLIGKKELDHMKQGAVLLNLSRGDVVDNMALRKAILSGKIKGCAVDVFPDEPLHNEEEFTSPLRKLPNTILTPHVGGSTQEAQDKIAHFVSTRLIEYINTGNSSKSVNMPNSVLPQPKSTHRLIHIHHNLPGVLAQINSTLSMHQANIIGQHLQTNNQTGYVITDIDKAYDSQLIDEMKKVKHTIKFRVLY